MLTPADMRARSLLGALALAGALAATGCEEKSQSSQALVVNVPLAVPAQYPGNGEVLAWVRVDGGTRQPLDVNADDTVSGVVRVDFGERTIEIIIEFDRDLLGVLELARATFRVTVDGGSVNLSFEQNDYVYANDDSDTYPNVAELIAGSDPLDGSDVPAPGSVPDSGRWNMMRWGQTNWR